MSKTVCREERDRSEDVFLNLLFSVVPVNPGLDKKNKKSNISLDVIVANFLS